MINKDYLVGLFNNIIPATFDDSITYLEQLILIRDKVNEIIDLVNEIVESGGSGYTLPPATTEKLGGIKVGQNLTIDEDGTLNAQAGGGGSYELPTASSETLGGVKVSGEQGIKIDDGFIRVSVDNQTIELYSPQMGEAWLKIKFDPNTLQIGENGLTVISGGGGSYELPIATRERLGGIKVV